MVLELPMKLDARKTSKGKDFQALNQIGSRFGGEQIGTDDKGNRVMANISIYLKPAQEASRSTSSYKIS